MPIGWNHCTSWVGRTSKLTHNDPNVNKKYIQIQTDVDIPIFEKCMDHYRALTK